MAASFLLQTLDRSIREQVSKACHSTTVFAIYDEPESPSTHASCRGRQTCCKS